MDFAHSDERQMLVATLDRYFRDNHSIEIRDAITNGDWSLSAKLWRELSDLGIVGALFEQEEGGFGGTAFDIAAIFEQIGRALVALPFLPTLLAGRVLVRAGGEKTLIGRVIAGDAVITLAHQEPQSRYSLTSIAARAVPDGAAFAITGCKAVVPFVEIADQIIVSARIDGTSDETGIALFIIERESAGVLVQGYPLFDGGRAGEIRLDAAPARIIALGGYAIIEEAIASGITALAWEAVGIMDFVKANTLDYLRTRQQFGAPIGKFQALQHRMATIALEIEQARSAAINAAAALGKVRAFRERAASAAKYTIGRVGSLVAEEAVQMHGGIGMTWELPLSHYAKRLTMVDHQLGDEDHHLERYTALSR